MRRVKRWHGLDEIKRLSSSSIQLAPNPLLIILNVMLIPVRQLNNSTYSTECMLSEYGFHANEQIHYITDRIVNRISVKGKMLLNFRVIASHSSSYWISYGPGLDGMSIT
jgi:hypothetical protein